MRHVQPLLNAYDDVFGWDRGLNFGLSLHLRPYFMYVSSGYSLETAPTFVIVRRHMFISSLLPISKVHVTKLACLVTSYFIAQTIC